VIDNAARSAGPLLYRPRVVSIVVSSYNYGSFLAKAIESALSQTYDATDVIVVDDGSTDDSREVIARYSGRVTAVLKENGGQASALNAGFAGSSGDVVIFLDSDDVLLPTAAENAVSHFNDPDVSKVHWPLIQVDAHGTRSEVLAPAQTLAEGDVTAGLVHHGPHGYIWPPMSGNAWARSFLERIFPMPELEYRTCPDLYLSALVPLFGVIRRLDEPQSLWRIHGTNQSWNGSFEERARLGAQRLEHCYRALSRYCLAAGIEVDSEQWKKTSWWQVYLATEELLTIIPAASSSFILVEQGDWETGGFIAGRRCIPFLEKDGAYWGIPADDATAITELERLREEQSPGLIVFAWPHLWWLDHYTALHHYLRSRYACIRENERLVAFDLRTPLASIGST